MKRVMFAAIGITLLAGVCVSSARTAGADETPALMKRKLQHSQKVLQGVAVQDFKMIERNADELIQISKLAEWRAFKTPTYEVYSNDFRRIAGALAENARKKNIDAATLSYVDLTLTCVKCHKHVREIRMTSHE
jgi:cytochrome c556